MPRACAVEFLTSPLLVAGNRRQTPDSPKDATGLPGGVFTLAATSRQPPDSSRDATGLPGGVSRSPLLVAKPWLSERCHRLARARPGIFLKLSKLVHKKGGYFHSFTISPDVAHPATVKGSSA